MVIFMVQFLYDLVVSFWHTESNSLEQDETKIVLNYRAFSAGRTIFSKFILGS